MREDMAKVLVERPRRGGGWERPGRRSRSLDDLPPRLKMAPGNGRTKWLNENLSPLERYLTSQAGRPWNKVYSEICARIDGRHTVQQHILLHLRDFVAFHTRVGEQGVEILGWNGWKPLADASAELYVDPRSGLLRVNRARELRQREPSRKLARAASALAESRCILGELEQLHRIDGIWYHVTLEVLPEPKLRIVIREGIATKEWICETRWDVVRSADVSRLHADGGPRNQPGNRALFGKANVYARTKHQLNTQQLRRHGLKG